MDISFFQNSLFLEALGNAILSSLWQGLLLWALYQCIVVGYKNINAKLKHNLSVLFIAGCFIWFINTFSTNFFAAQPLNVMHVDAANFNGSANLKNSFFDFFFSFSAGILPYLSVAYLVLVLFLMLKLYTSYRHVRFISTQNLISPSSHLGLFCENAVKKLQIAQKITVWISAHIEVPATIGFIKPVILIPLASINNLTVQQLEAIILHELSHIRRNDYLINLVVSIVETVLFFNPFVAFFIKEIKRERENCCDDFVLGYSYDPHSYASALLRLEQSRKTNVQLALGAVSGKKQLLLRIKRITGNSSVTPFNYGQKLLALLITTGIFCSIAWLSPQKTKKEDTATFKASSTTKSAALETTVSNNALIQPSISTKDKNEKDLKPVKADSPVKNSRNEIATVGSKEEDFSFQKNSDRQFSTTASLPANHINVEELIARAAPNINIKNMEGLNEEIENGLKMAYAEIAKIDWKDVQKDINESFSEISIQHLPQKQKEAIISAKKFLSVLNLDKQRISAAKLLNQIENQQKTINDSLRAAGRALLNQRPAKLALRAEASQQKENAGTIDNFSFNYNVEPRRKVSKGKVTGKPRAEIFEIDGENFRINTSTTTFPRATNERQADLKAKVYHRVIADI